MIHTKTNAQLLKEFDKYVIGHQEAKKALIKLVNRSKTAHYHKYLAEEKTEDIETLSCLLIGPSGTGKTHLVNTLQKLVSFPLIRVDATTLGPNGSAASGGIDTVIKDMTSNAQVLAQSSHEYHSAYGALDQTIVFIDEFDKLAHEWESTGGWMRRTQATLLTLIENDEQFKNVSFIFAGAFGGIEEVQERENNTSIGFNSTVEKGEIKQVTDRDVIKYGLMPELVGRIGDICVLDVVDYETMETILRKTIIPNKIDQLSKFMDVNDTAITDDMIDELINNALESGQGARSLKRGVERVFSEMEFNFEVVEDMKLLGGN
jgi:ATP-dependent Clp protease ATP-binding subunit ClpX